MAYQYIIYEKMEGLGRIKLNRPKKLNALNPEVYKELEDVFMDCEKDPEVKVLIIMGTDRSFAAGADIDEMAKGDVVLAYKLTDQSQRTQERLADMPKPTVAAIAGYALGGGLELSLCCDFRIASDNAVLGLPEINLGIIPGGGGTQRLTRLIGASRSAELIFLGEPIKADQAEKWGLVNKVVPLNGLELECEKLAKILMTKSPIALRAAKTSMRTGMNVGLKEGLKIEQDIFCMLFGTSDQKEGMGAFLEKRTPTFTGR
jgi:enoyl-CoA hydratase